MLYPILKNSVSNMDTVTKKRGLRYLQMNVKLSKEHQHLVKFKLTS